MNFQEMVSRAVRYPLACRLGFHAYRWATPYAGYRRGYLGDPIFILQADHCQGCGRVTVEERGPAHAFYRNGQPLVDAEINLL